MKLKSISVMVSTEEIKEILIKNGISKYQWKIIEMDINKLYSNNNYINDEKKEV